MGTYALAQAGDADALRMLVRRHLPLVQALSKRFPYSEDAFQQGCLGLVRAIRRYREDAGFSFSTYAVPVILGDMRRAFSHTLGWRAQAAVKKARQYHDACVRRSGVSPGIRETAKYAGVSPEELSLLLEWDQGPVYDGTGTLLSTLPDPRGEEWLLRLCVRDALSRLPSKDGWLLRRRYWAGQSQTELARLLRLSQPKISRWESRARRLFRAQWEDEKDPIT